jgi:hypothetical protein
MSLHSASAVATGKLSVTRFQLLEEWLVLNSLNVIMCMVLQCGIGPERASRS